MALYKELDYDQVRNIINPPRPTTPIQNNTYNTIGQKSGVQAAQQSTGGLEGFLGGLGNTIGNVGRSLLGLFGTGAAAVRDLAGGSTSRTFSLDEMQDTINKNRNVEGIDQRVVDSYQKALDTAKANGLNQVTGYWDDDGLFKLGGEGKNQSEFKKWLYGENDKTGTANYARTAGEALDAAATLSNFIPGANGLVGNTLQGAASGFGQAYADTGGNLEAALKSAAAGGAAGLATGGLNKGLNNAIAKGGKLANLATSKPLASTIARGALSGAVGGAVGGGTAAGLNNGDILAGASQGAGSGLAGGALAAPVMYGTNKLISKTPLGGIQSALNEMEQDYQTAKQNGQRYYGFGSDNKAETAPGRLRDTYVGGDIVKGAEKAGRYAIDKAKNPMLGMGIKDVSGQDMDLQTAKQALSEVKKNNLDQLKTVLEYNYDSGDTRIRFTPDEVAQSPELNQLIKDGKIKQFGNSHTVFDIKPTSKWTDTDIENLTTFLNKNGYGGVDQNGKFDPYGEIKLQQTPVLSKKQANFNDLSDQYLANNTPQVKPDFVGVDSLGNKKNYSQDDFNKLAEEYNNYQKSGAKMSGNSFSEGGEALGKAGDELLTIYNTMNGGGVGNAPIYDQAENQKFNDWIKANGNKSFTDLSPSDQETWLKIHDKQVISKSDLSKTLKNDYGVDTKGMSRLDMLREYDRLRYGTPNQTAEVLTNTTQNIAEESTPTARKIEVNMPRSRKKSINVSVNTPAQEPVIEEPIPVKTQPEITPETTETTPNRYGLAYGESELAGRTAAQSRGNINEQTQTNAYADAQKKLLSVKSRKQKEAAAKDLLNQLGTAPKPAAKAYKMIDNAVKLSERGLTTPEQWEIAADSITGRNGKISKLHTMITSTAGDIDTWNGINGKSMDQTIEKLIGDNGLAGTDAEKAIRREIQGALGMLPSRQDGSLTGMDDAADVMDVIRNLEAKERNYRGDDGGNHSTSDPLKRQKADTIGAVANILEDRIYDKVGDVSPLMTKEVISDLKNIFPGNKKWANYVDNDIATIKTGKELRAAQKPYVQTSNYLSAVKENFGTYGQRVGDVYGNAAAQALKKVPVVGSILAQAADSPIANRAYAKVHNIQADMLDKQANRLSSQIPRTTTRQTQTPAPETLPGTMLPVDRLGNAIGRAEGARAAGNSLEAQLANMNTNEASQATQNGLNGDYYTGADVYGNTAMPTTYNTGYNTQANAGTDMLNRLQRAMELAIEAGDGTAVSQLMGMYTDLAKIYQTEEPKQTKLTEAQRKAYAAESTLNELLNMGTDDTGNYWMRNIPVVGTTLQNITGGDKYTATADSLALQIGFLLSGANVPDDEKERIKNNYIPLPTDSPAVKEQKLKLVRNILNDFKQTYAE